MKKLFTLLFPVLLSAPVFSQTIYQLSDPWATHETTWLYSSMQRLVGAGVIFGHHDDTAYGIGWRFNKGGSDVKRVTGSYPALYEWDFAGKEHDSLNDINGIPFKFQRKLVRQVYDRGGINEFCWHMDNPSNEKNAWDTTYNSVNDILPDGTHNAEYLKYLDRVATYIKTMKGPDGEAIPILFRPFHELTGSWFWWGQNACSADKFKELWRYTITYLRKDKGLHNLILVYSVADFNNEDEFLDRYPGDSYVDVIGFDNYCTTNVADFQKNLDNRMAVQLQIAKDHHKLACIAETGYKGIPMPDWWTKVVLPELTKYDNTSFMLLWRNAGTDQYYVPYPGQVSAADFKAFFDDRHTMFQNRLSNLGVYGKAVIAE